MIEIGLERIVINTPVQLEQVTTPTFVKEDTLKLYAKDSGGTTVLCYKDDAGVEHCTTPSGGFGTVDGSGVANRLAYWVDTDTLDDVPRTFTSGSVLFAHTDFLPQEDNANFFWDDTNNRLGIGTASPSTKLHVKPGTNSHLLTRLGSDFGTGFSGVAIHSITDAVADAMLVLAGEKVVVTGDNNAARLQLMGSDGVVVADVMPNAPTSASTIRFQMNGGTANREAFMLLVDGNDLNNSAYLAMGSSGSLGGTGSGIVNKAFFDSSKNGTGVTKPISFMIDQLEKMIISTGGNILIGTTTAPSTGTAGLVFGDGTALATMASNTAGMYANDVAGNVEMFTIAEDGRTRDLLWPREARVGTQFDKTNDAALANVTNLTHTVAAGFTYTFEAVLHVDANVTGGSKYAIGGTATATSIKYNITLIDDTTNALTITSRQTALGGSAGQSGTTTGFCLIKGTIVVSAGGTLTVQFAQNAATPATTSSVLTDSSFTVDQH